MQTREAATTRAAQRQPDTTPARAQQQPEDGDTRGPNLPPATRRKFVPTQHPSKPCGEGGAVSERSADRRES